MTGVSLILSRIESGDAQAAEELLPLVYDELRRLAAQRLAHERPGQTIQATALVHEAYLRLVGGECPQIWDNRWHFFAAAAEAMRRIVLNRARDKKRLKRGGDFHRVDFQQVELGQDDRDDEIMALDEALEELERQDPKAAQIVKLRFYAGLTHREVAAALGMSQRSAERQWAFAQAWLYDHLRRGEDAPNG